MNHPYSDSKTWVPYAVSQYELGYAKELILLIKLDVSTRWWKSVSQYPFFRRLLSTRDLSHCIDGRGAAPFQSQLYILEKDLDRFNDVFGKYGTLYVPHRNLSHNMETNLSKLL